MTTTMTTTTTPRLIAVHPGQLENNPWQPRTHVDHEATQQLRDNIAAVGLLQRPLVRPHPENATLYQIAFGHRRVEAVRLLIADGAPWTSIPVDVRDLTDTEMAVVALSENQRRKDITPLETYRAYRKAIDETDLTIESLSQQLQLDRSTLSNSLRVLKLPKQVLDLVGAGEMSMHAAREFLCLVAEDHEHKDIMEQALSIIRRPSAHREEARPNYTVKAVRSAIEEAVRYTQELDKKTGYGWRQLYKSSLTAVSFDVDAFRKDFPHHVHGIPAADPKGEKSQPWTCMGKEWGKRQAAATREINKAKKEGGDASAVTEGTKRHEEFLGVLSKDELAREVILPRKDKKLKGITSEEADKLGTRAKPLYGYGRMEEFRQELTLEGYRALPFFFPDLEECLTRCTIGARYAQQWQGGPFALVCTNQEHFTEKLQRGLQEQAAKVQDIKAQADQEDSDLSIVVRAHVGLIDERAQKALLLALMAGHPRFMAADPLGAGNKYPQLHFVPLAQEEIKKELGIRAGDRWFDLGVQHMDKALGLHAAHRAHLIGNLVAAVVREGTGNGVAVLLGRVKPEEPDPTEPEPTPSFPGRTGPRPEKSKKSGRKAKGKAAEDGEEQGTALSPAAVEWAIEAVLRHVEGRWFERMIRAAANETEALGFCLEHHGNFGTAGPDGKELACGRDGVHVKRFPDGSSGRVPWLQVIRHARANQPAAKPMEVPPLYCRIKLVDGREGVLTGIAHGPNAADLNVTVLTDDYVHVRASAGQFERIARIASSIAPLVDYKDIASNKAKVYPVEWGNLERRSQGDDPPYEGIRLGSGEPWGGAGALRC